MSSVVFLAQAFVFGGIIIDTFLTCLIHFMDNFSGAYVSTCCKLIFIDSPAFLHSPVVCIRYDDHNETLKEVCAESKNALFRASRNLKNVIDLKSGNVEQIAVLQGEATVAEAGYWVLCGEFGAAVRASNRLQFEKAWALAALIGLASFSPLYEPIQFSSQKLDEWFIIMCAEITSRASMMGHHIYTFRPPPPKSLPADASPPGAIKFFGNVIPPPPLTPPPVYALSARELNNHLCDVISSSPDSPQPQ